MKYSLKIPFAKYALVLVLMMGIIMPVMAEAFVVTPSGLPLSATNMVPGSVAAGGFSINNDTATSQKIAFQISSTTGDYALFADWMTYSMVGASINKSGNLSELTVLQELSDLPAGDTHDYTLTLTLKDDAPQDPLMGKGFGFDIVILSDEVVVETITVIPSGDDSFVSGGSISRVKKPAPKVLGASTDTCEQLLTTYIRPGKQNDSYEVMKLQMFLRDLEGHQNLVVTGVYDTETQQAVASFQEKYADKVLQPWGLPVPTMFVYYTTRKMVNEIYCDFNRDFPLTADQEREIAWYREQGTTYRQATTIQEDGGGLVEGVSTTVETVLEKGQKVSTTVGEQVASSVAAGTGFFAGIWNWFIGLFSW